MKKILGLDLGTNSIGWAVINKAENEDKDVLCGIEAAGSRIIPMDATIMGDFEKGNSVSQTKDRREHRSTRRLYERSKLRRERLNRVLSVMGFLPDHYVSQLDRYGKFLSNTEPKLAWVRNADCKYHFLFMNSFSEMLQEFKTNSPQCISKESKVPYDWTLYYLRKKALTQKVSKEELAWILLSFNQKRGYFQLRDESEEEKKPSKTRQYFEHQRVVDIIDTNEVYKGLKILVVVLSNGVSGKIFKKEIPDWIGEEKDIIVKIDIDKDGKDKFNEDGSLSCRFNIPTEAEWDTEWELIKQKTQNDLDVSGKTVGEYIFDTLLRNPDQKVRGKLVRTIERRYYKEEINAILKKQKEFHPEFSDKSLYEKCVEELYPNNPAHRNMMLIHDLSYFLVNDILFYQRPLKSKKSLIDECPYESHLYIDKKSGERKPVAVKCIAKSHPLYQEFRLWQFISNLRIYQKTKEVGNSLKVDVDVTNEFLKGENDYVELFDWLNTKKEIKQEDFLKYKPFGFTKSNINNYRWNYVEDKIYPCNKTHYTILKGLEKADITFDEFISHDSLAEENLWHILYSVSSKEELKHALESFADKRGLSIKFVDAFINTPAFEKSYGAYSAKAIKKLLPLMRMGKYWKEENICDSTRERIDKIITGEYDENIRDRVREKSINLTDITLFRGLPLWLACYVVYDRHSEAGNTERWTSPSDIDHYIRKFKQHSLRNPIVEQIVLETLRTVRDVWTEVGGIDEIHVELGREMKNPSDKRRKMSLQMQENENTNLRIKALLAEFINPELGIENVRPYSPSQQDLLRLYEEGAWNSPEIDEKQVDEMLAILKKFNETDSSKRPTKSEIKRYRLWLEQKYRSPYTGTPIPLSKLFTTAYEIEHVIPRSRFFDDSLTNKVICESEVNKLKGNMLGYEFIKSHYGEKVQLSSGSEVQIFSVNDYEKFVKDHYSKNKAKMKKLLMDDIPEKFTERQMNDSRYISRLIVSLLSNIVREKGEQESISKNVLVCTGGVTDRLKNDWGVNDIWNRIILPRFKRMNEITDSTDYTSVNTSGHIIPVMPLHLQKGFNKKRIDHRHHAMDAIVIACAGRNIVNYLNNQSSKSDVSRHDLRNLLCERDKSDRKELIIKPWDTFTQDVYSVLSSIIVSIKQNLRVINKTKNIYQRKVDGKIIMSKQEDNINWWAIRKPLHKEIVRGEVNLRKETTISLKEAIDNPTRIIDKDLKKKLRELIIKGYNEKLIKKYFEDNNESWQEVNLKKIPAYYFTKDTKDRYFASRSLLDESFDMKKIENKITDTGIRTILLRHLEVEGGDSKVAFSPEGLERMNKNIEILNGGKKHKPIYKVREYEKAEKFAVGMRGNKASKFVEAAKGTNLFFAVYDNGKKRSFATVPLNEVIRLQKEGLPSAPANEEGLLPKFVLSPNDLVYVPTEDELRSGLLPENPAPERIYKMVSCTGNEAHFIPAFVAYPLIQTQELGSNNKAQRAWTNEMIKEICIPLKVSRLGKIMYNL